MRATPRLPAGYSLTALDEIDSTNEEAARRAAARAPEGTIVWALAQSGGRGRRGRSWTSGTGNLYCSILLRPHAAPAIAAQLSFVAALAVADTVRTALPADAVIRLKWPNDVLVNGGKIAGILLEASGRADGMLDRLVIGIGLNLRHHPDATATPATDLAAEGAPELSPAAALERLIDAFDGWRLVWEEKGFEPIRSAWLQGAWRLGEEIQVNLPHSSTSGIFADLDVEGSLVLETAPGIQRRIAAGEVFPAAA